MTKSSWIFAEPCGSTKVTPCAGDEAIHQTWLALQIGRSFVERAGGHPQFLLNSGNPDASKRHARKEKIQTYLDNRIQKRKKQSKNVAD